MRSLVKYESICPGVQSLPTRVLEIAVWPRAVLCVKQHMLVPREERWHNSISQTAVTRGSGQACLVLIPQWGRTLRPGIHRVRSPILHTSSANTFKTILLFWSFGRACIEEVLEVDVFALFKWQWHRFDIVVSFIIKELSFQLGILLISPIYF